MIKPNSIPLPKRNCYYKWYTKGKCPTLDEILCDICNSFGVSIDDILAKKRSERLVKCRRIYCYVSNVLTNESCNSISEKIKRDHTTYLWHLGKCIEWFTIGDSKFIAQWQEYLDKNTIWNTYFEKQKTA